MDDQSAEVKAVLKMVGAVGIEPTLTALSRQCLRVYKARPWANISNAPELVSVGLHS